MHFQNHFESVAFRYTSAANGTRIVSFVGNGVWHLREDGSLSAHHTEYHHSTPRSVGDGMTVNDMAPTLGAFEAAWLAAQDGETVSHDPARDLRARLDLTPGMS